MLTTAQIEEILSQFQIDLSNFDIVNIEEKKGWSSRYLFLIVEHNDQFLLKGKSEEQLSGYIADTEISDFLKSKGFNTRDSIKTKSGEHHFIQDDIYWDLKTYIPGSVVHFAEYNDISIISLAQVNTSYLNSSLNNHQIKSLRLEERDVLDIKPVIEDLTKHKNTLAGVIGNEPKKFNEWFNFAQNELTKILMQNTDFSIIHNDLNNKNILLDLNSDKVTSFIDWDHGCISTPLKDVVEPINTFYDYAPEAYEHMREIYFKEINNSYQINLSEAELNLLQTYLYALNKWKYISFFAQLIKNDENTAKEVAEFEDVVRTQLSKLNGMGRLYNVF